MKKTTIIVIALFVLSVFTCQTARAQFKIHSNGRITFQSTLNSATQGVVIDPYPSCSTTVNGDAHFTKLGVFRKVTGAYGWLNCAITSNDHSVAWVVSPDWSAVKFYVDGNGSAYAMHHYTFSQNQNNSKVQEPIEGVEALEAISGLNGYYFPPENQEIPDLENNENVDPEAVAAMYADFEKRSVGLSGVDFAEAFPEGVRTDHQNRLCIDYPSVVTMLVEAVKEQQREIEELRKTLKDNGLLNP